MLNSILQWYASTDGQLKVFFARESPNGDEFVQPLSEIQRVLKRSVITKREHALATNFSIKRAPYAMSCLAGLFWTCLRHPLALKVGNPP